MRRMFLFSLLIHLAILGGIAVYTGLRRREPTIRRIYTVHMVHLPATERSIEPRPVPVKPPEQKKRLMPPKPKPAPPVEKTPEKTSPSAATTEDVKPSGLRLDVVSFPFPEYLYALKARIEENWRIPYTGISSGSERTTVFFQILRDGRISRAFVEDRSGVVAFDQAALNAVIRSAPFLSLPEKFQGDHLGVHFVFEYEE